MTELTPAVLALKTELGQAIRRDHLLRKRRRKAVRTGALSLGALLALSGSAVAAGEVLGVIDLTGGVTATRVSSVPVSGHVVALCPSNTCAAGAPSDAPFIYHLVGGQALRVLGGIRCGPADGGVTTNSLYLTSTRALTAAQLQGVVGVPNAVQAGGGLQSASPAFRRIPAGVAVILHVCP